MFSITNVNARYILHLWKQNKEGIVSYAFYKRKAIIIKLYAIVFIYESHSCTRKYKISSHLSYN